MIPEAHLTAGQISNKLNKDTTKYDAREVGQYMVDEVGIHLNQCVDNHLNHQDETGNYPWRELPQFCVIMQLGKDPLLKNVTRRKFYCCPFLPSPRPNQAVFLYERKADRITKRLWILPSDMVMAELASLIAVDEIYKTMQAWSIAFFEGKFWEYIRHEHDLKMCSQQEYISHHRKELIEAGCELVNSDSAEPFDFSKIFIKKVVDPQIPVTN